jgi:hypothetical protein
LLAGRCGRYIPAPLILTPSPWPPGKQADQTGAIATAAGKIRGAADNFSSGAKGIKTKTGEAVDQFQRLADAATVAADTASETLQHSTKQFELDERPYLVKEYIKIKKPEMGEKLFGEVLWRNTGKTPALHASMYLRIDVLDQESDSPEEWESLARNNASGHLEIGSNLTRATDVTGDNFLSGEWWNRISARTHKLYVFGALVYEDIFKEWHATDFCGLYEPGSIEEASLWACHNGNQVK